MRRNTPTKAVFPNRDALVRREFLASTQIPYTAQVSGEYLVKICKCLFLDRRLYGLPGIQP